MDRVKLRADLIVSEALKTKPYTDTKGKLTIGVGRNLTDVGLTRSECLFLLDNDIDRSEKECLLTFPWFRELNDVRQRAICEMNFNLGLPKLRNFRKMEAAIRAKDWETAAIEALDSDWSRDVGNRALRIAEMIRSGKEI